MQLRWLRLAGKYEQIDWSEIYRIEDREMEMRLYRKGGSLNLTPSAKDDPQIELIRSAVRANDEWLQVRQYRWRRTEKATTELAEDFPMYLRIGHLVSMTETAADDPIPGIPAGIEIALKGEEVGPDTVLRASGVDEERLKKMFLATWPESNPQSGQGSGHP